MTRNKAFARALLTLAVMCSSASALPAAEPLVNAPVAINACVFGAGSSANLIGYGVEFTNTSKKIITDVRFRFTFTSKFDEPLMSVVVVDSGTFSPNVAIDHRTHGVAQLLGGDTSGSNYYFTGHNVSNQPIGALKVGCQVDAVSFQDGSVFKAEAPAAASRSEAASAPPRKSGEDATVANRHHTTARVTGAWAAVPESAVPDAVLSGFRRRFTREGDVLTATAEACQENAQYKGIQGWYAIEPPLADVDKANNISSKIYYEYRVKFYRSSPRADWQDIGADFHSDQGSPYQAVAEKRGGAVNVQPAGPPCL